MDWSTRLREAMPREEIPAFLADLQALVAALREDQPWQEHWTPLLEAHAALAIDYLNDGDKKDAVRRHVYGSWPPGASG